MTSDKRNGVSGWALLCCLLLTPQLLAQSATAEQPPVPALKPTIRSLVEYDEYTGRFEAVERVELRARVSGYLDQVAFTEGQLVEPGMLLYVIDQRPFQIALAAAEAGFAEVKSALDLARVEARRARSLRKDRAISQEELDQREQEELGARARVARARAEVDQARLNLEFTEVRAPTAGRVGRQLVDVGNLVSGGDVQGTLLTTIVSQDPIHFYFEVSEADFLRYVRLGDEGSRPSSRTTPNAVSVRLLDEDKYLHHGVMDFVDNELDSTSGTMEGRAVFANDGELLQPGVFGRLRLLGSGRYDAVLVPDEVVQFDQSRRYVLIIEEDGTVGRRWVEPGPINDGLRIIRDGLSGDETLVGGAFHRIREGQQVTPQLESEANSGSSKGAGR